MSAKPRIERAALEVFVRDGVDAATTRAIATAAGVSEGALYRHYKGKDYLVVGVSRHSETEEELVVYRQLYGDHGLWVRPRAMFLETIELNGRLQPRFAYIGPE